MGYRVINGKLYPVGEFPTYETKDKKQANTSNSFENILNREIEKNSSFTFSNHAVDRLKDRNIFLNEADMKKINEGINKASEKGSKESLILYKDVILLASIKNRTIITAMDKESSKDNVFTNIDSVVLI